MWRFVLPSTIGASAVLLGYNHVFNPIKVSECDSASLAQKTSKRLRCRKEIVDRTKTTHYDVLVIGGGATGAGIALDAITRGLSVALVEKEDFGAGTSSRSSKLIHGGVRYLEKAFTSFDMSQFELVRDALRERRHLLSIAPHLSRPLPIIVPLYTSFPSILFVAPYYWAGLKVYDLFAGSDGILEPSFFISRREALEKFPMLQSRNLQCGIVYYDGQHDDARMNLGIAMTAISEGADAINHVEVKSLVKTDNGRVCGANVHSVIDGSQWLISAKTVVNATGPFADTIRRMDDVNAKDIIVPSAGVHVTLSDRYSPKGMGLIVPQTKDGRVLFLLPWEGSTIAGTTDSSTVISDRPVPHEEEISFILDEASKYLVSDVKRTDVDAAWSGIRPLALTPSSTNSTTQEISRDHVIEVRDVSGLITIAGGKWTTYRKMAEDVVDEIAPSTVGKCCTTNFKLIGAKGWSLALPTTLIRQGFDDDIAEHLASSYGDRAPDVATLARTKQATGRLHAGYVFTDAELVYSLRHEFAETLLDLIARRTRLAFLNSDVSLAVLSRVLHIAAAEKEWSTQRRLDEMCSARNFLDTMNVRDKISKERLETIVQAATSLPTKGIHTMLNAIEKGEAPNFINGKGEVIEKFVKQCTGCSSLGKDNVALLQHYMASRKHLDAADIIFALSCFFPPNKISTKFDE